MNAKIIAIDQNCSDSQRNVGCLGLRVTHLSVKTPVLHLKYVRLIKLILTVFLDSFGLHVKKFSLFCEEFCD